MDTLFLGIVIFLIVLAVFDLVVGVSNDAVNFLNSAIGARVARYRTIVTIAAVGVFVGASLSNGMMDVARHGIMTPQYFSLTRRLVDSLTRRLVDSLTFRLIRAIRVLNHLCHGQKTSDEIQFLSQK